MPLTPDQLLTLKAAIDADGALASLPNGSDEAVTIAAAFNATASPQWVVWRTAVTRREVLQNGFDWTRLDNLSVGKARVWSDIFVDGTINPSKPNVRTGVAAVWTGTQADLNVQAAVFGHCKKDATRLQKLFSTGAGTTNSPATMADNLTESYKVSASEVVTARNLS
jgi:hypothetical protein